MTLDKHIANWTNLGVMPYQETMEVQNRLVALRKEGKIPDTILAVQHPPEINFGTSAEHNLFSADFLNNHLPSSIAPTDEAVTLALSAVGINFSRSDRGGGATAFAPGQYVFYPIVDHTQITGRALDVADYKARIYRIMFQSLNNLGVQINLSQDSSLLTRGDRRDVWLQQNGISYKLGSKGLRFSGSVAHHGFSLYVNKNGLAPFWAIKPCGYDSNEVRVKSVEEVLGRIISQEEVYRAVRSKIAEQFGYDEVRDIQAEELLGATNG